MPIRMQIVQFLLDLKPCHVSKIFTFNTSLPTRCLDRWAANRVLNWVALCCIKRSIKWNCWRVLKKEKSKKKERARESSARS